MRLKYQIVFVTKAGYRVKSDWFRERPPEDAIRAMKEFWPCGIHLLPDPPKVARVLT